MQQLTKIAGHFALWLAASSISVTAHADDLPLRAGEVESATAMELAPMILPPEILPTVISGKKRREFVAGPRYWLGYDTAPFETYIIPDDFCLRYQIVVRLEPKLLADLQQWKSTPDAEKEMQVTSLSRTMMVAMPLAGGVSLQNCAASEGYIGVSYDSQDETLDGYRQLVSLIQRARSGAPLPAALDCLIPAEIFDDGEDVEDDRDSEDEEWTRCESPRTAIADLPMQELFDISMNDDPDEGELAGFMASFGPSGENDHSWRINWMPEQDGQISELRMIREQVVYH